METTENIAPAIDGRAEMDDRPVALWETTLAKMRQQGIKFGSRFSTAWLAHELNRPADSIAFGSGIAAMNEELIEEGYYLSARNQNGEYYQVVSPESAEAVGDAWSRDAMRKLRRKITLLGGLLGNEAAALNEEQKRRLQSKQEKTAFQLVMMRRAGKFRQLAEKHAPKLLEG